MKTLPCFKAYDVRGKVPDELDEDLAYRIGRAFAVRFGAKRISVGHDVRLSGPSLATALARGMNDAGADVIHLGLCGTEEIYFSAFHLDVDGGVIVTASHNPAEYNGMKFVLRGAKPVSGDSGLRELEAMAVRNLFPPAPRAGAVVPGDCREAYIQHLLGYIDKEKLSPLKIVANSGNGCAGPVIDRLEKALPFSFVKIHHEPDGGFPNGVPNPLLPEKREMTAQTVRDHGADLGIAWDGDFDRCFFFDEKGMFMEGYYIVGLLAETMLAKSPGEKIIHDPRLVWNTRELVMQAGGSAVMSKTGHAFIKERMRSENALYGGEMSAHHYFRDFAYCDSGMIPWLLVAELLCRSRVPLSEMVRERMEAYPVSGEINSLVKDPDASVRRVETSCESAEGLRDYTDGFSFEASRFRFNIRKSNTEPVLRLNVETRGDRRLLRKKTEELLALIRQ